MTPKAVAKKWLREKGRNQEEASEQEKERNLEEASEEREWDKGRNQEETS